MWNNIKCIYAVAAVVQYTKNVACNIQDVSPPHIRRERTYSTKFRVEDWFNNIGLVTYYITPLKEKKVI